MASQRSRSGRGDAERTTHLEFGGIPGAVAMLIGLPATVYFINFSCNMAMCTPWVMPHVPGWSYLFDRDAMLMVLGWFAFQLLLYIIPTGTIVEGLPLRNGTRLKYRCNAFINLVLTLVLFCYLVMAGYHVSVVYDKFIQIVTAAFTLATVLSVLLYVKACRADSDQLAPGGNTGNFIYDFFIGHELNPRVGQVDLKYFCELRPGLMGWLVLDLCFIAKSCELHGSPSPTLVVVTLFHACYIMDALWFEEAILTTMDIVHDGFGFMLVFGDLVWVPFLYSLQARFLLEHPQHWSPLILPVFIILHVMGFTIFRGANSEKNAFRKNPLDDRLAHLRTISTKSGRKLLVSGWWGMSRHPNYLGDLVMSLSWSLPCGFEHILPYFYPIYFLGLLLHRSGRDDENCRKKYGADWDRYCQLVKYRIFPYIY